MPEMQRETINFEKFFQSDKVDPKEGITDNQNIMVQLINASNINEIKDFFIIPAQSK
jgi:hypothetical protein